MRRISLMKLPAELQIEIFLRMPVRSLLICKCLCKPFRTLIQNPDFAKTHFTRNRSISTAHTSQSLILEFDDTSPNNQLLVSIDNTTNDVISCSHLTPQIPYVGGLRVVGSCHGLICLSVDNLLLWNPGNNLLLWNPVTRQTRYLPKPQNERYVHRILEFCFNPETKDYIVLIIQLGSDGILVEMYKMSIDSWTIIDCNSFTGLDHIPIYNIFQPGTSVFVEGSFHWGAYDDDSNYIVSFNLKDEKLGLIDTVDPAKATSGDWDPVRMEKSLAVLYRGFRYNFQLWVMNDYGVQDSWVLMFQSSSTFVGRPLACWKNTLIISYQNALYLYDIDTENWKKLPKSEGCYENEMYFYSFLDTLAPVRILP